MKTALLRAAVGVIAGMLAAAIVVRVSAGPGAWSALGALASGAVGIHAGPPTIPGDPGIHLGAVALHLSRYELAQSLSRATPLLLCGLAVVLALRAGMFNIGAQGQMTLGALAGAVVGAHAGTTGGWLWLPLMLAAGVAAGAALGAIAGVLKAARGVHEVLSTIMLNYLAINCSTYLASGPWKDHTSMAVQTPAIGHAAELANWVRGANFSAGFLIALAAAVLLSLLIGRTAVGFDIRAVGAGAEAARANGVQVARVLTGTMAGSGALAGLAGAIEVAAIHHRYVDGVAASYGFDGIAVALLGALTPAGVVASALFFGALQSGAAFMQLQTNVSDSLASIVEAVIILAVGVRCVPRRPEVRAAPDPIEQIRGVPAESAPL